MEGSDTDFGGSIRNGASNTIEDSSEASTLQVPTRDFRSSTLSIDIPRSVNRDETAESVLSHMTKQDFECPPTEPVHKKVLSEENYSSLIGKEGGGLLILLDANIIFSLLSWHGHRFAEMVKEKELVNKRMT
ncbi:hypothetical protein HDU76_007777 [Blyttiomyces sp. JEL0837]|nr:hypothetical protein HDU76_007777 [Blyttiomyces sp. JEL0837]